MMKYEVVAYFTDLQDDRHAYNVGDEFPRQGMSISEERIAELSTTNNKRGRVFIKAVESEEAVKEDKPKQKKGRKKNEDVE